MIKKIVLKLHLVLGLISGIIVFIVSITGALYAFKDEIEHFTQPYKYVEASHENIILPSEAITIGEQANPGVTIHGVVYQKPTDAIQIIYYQSDPFYYGATYINPYTGHVIQSVDFMKTFFGFIRRGHATLWLPVKFGSIIVLAGTIMFVVLLVTGIVLWWPRKNSSSKSFSFTKADKPTIKRLEYHKVIGFYVSFFALIIALTGLSWSIKGLDSAIYKAIGGEKEIRWNPPQSDTSKKYKVSYKNEQIDILYSDIKKNNADISFIEVHTIENDSSIILIELNRAPSSHRKIDYLYFDQHTLKAIETNNFYGKYENAKIPDKIRRSYYDIHSGSILGIPGKFLAFFISLFCASLPVTGIILWRKRKKEKNAFLKKLNM